MREIILYRQFGSRKGGDFGVNPTSADAEGCWGRGRRGGHHPGPGPASRRRGDLRRPADDRVGVSVDCVVGGRSDRGSGRNDGAAHRSEEHTSELQSRRDLVCRLLLEKKKKKYI